MVETGPDRENPSPAVEYAVKLARFDTEVYARDMGRARSEEAQRRFFEARLRYHLFDNGLQLLVQRLGLRRWPKAHAYELGDYWGRFPCFSYLSRPGGLRYPLKG